MRIFIRSAGTDDNFRRRFFAVHCAPSHTHRVPIQIPFFTLSFSSHSQMLNSLSSDPGDLQEARRHDVHQGYSWRQTGQSTAAGLHPCLTPGVLQVTDGLLGQLAKGWEYAFLFAFEASCCFAVLSCLHISFVLYISDAGPVRTVHDRSGVFPPQRSRAPEVCGTSLLSVMILS